MKKESFTCRRCGTLIGGHNQYLHAGMCDACFFEVYFPEEAQIFEIDAKNLSRLCRLNYKANMDFKDFMKSGKVDQRRFKAIVKEVTGKIDCTQCGNCCKKLKPCVTENDIERISQYLHITTDSFIKQYLMKNTDGEFEFNHAPCSFLQKDNRCKIYEVRPRDCQSYPHLQNDVTYRCLQFFANAEVCPIVFNVLENSKVEFSENINESRFAEQLAQLDVLSEEDVKEFDKKTESMITKKSIH